LLALEESNLQSTVLAPAHATSASSAVELVHSPWNRGQAKAGRSCHRWTCAGTPSEERHGYPKIQLFTVTDRLAGQQIDMPPIRQVGATFKKAPRALPPAPIALELPLPGTAP
jgi:hypothetical protein